MDQFDIEFNEWLTRAVENGVPTSVRAFSFNLFELAPVDGAKFAVEVVGTSEFSRTDSDWACDENWKPVNRVLNIPVSFSGDTWEECLSAVRSLIQSTLEGDNKAARVLRSREGIGVGFVDGDMQIMAQVLC